MSEILSPVDYLIEELPSLITSRSPHDVEGASIIAEYLNDYAPDVPGAKNLRPATHNLAGLVLDNYPPLKKMPELFGKLTRPSLEKACRGFGLMALAFYKAGVTEVHSEDITELLEASRKELGPFGRFMVLHRNIRPYYENILSKEELTESELIAAQAARLHVRKHSPTVHYGTIGIRYARKERKHLENLKLPQ